MLVGTIGRTLARWQARRVAAPLDRRRHRRTLPAARGEATRRAGTTWWGGERRWFQGGTPPRVHNRIAPLIDGEHYFAALREELAAAQSYVYIIGWSLTPHMPLARGSSREMIETQLTTLLHQTAARVPVRILLWSGASMLFQPTRSEMESVARELESSGGGDLRCRLDTSARFSHCHHQKAIVIDGQIAFLGGMDLSALQGDRWDTQHHPLRSGPNWHDVQIRIEGEAVADVEHNFRQRWQAVTGDGDLPHREPATNPTWRTEAQIVRTIPRKNYPALPEGEHGIRHAYIETLRAARKLIYLENQYLWSPEIMDALLAALHADRDGSFRMVIVLPARAYDGKWDNDKHVEELRKADGGRGRVSVYSPYSSAPATKVDAFLYHPTYVHAKVAVVDDEWAIVGSANLNDRGLITDSEICELIHDPEVARGLRVALWAEHLRLPEREVALADPATLIDDHWQRCARENAAIIEAGKQPLVCAVHRYERGRMPGDWVLEEAESLTVDH